VIEEATMIARRMCACAVLLWVGAAHGQTFPADGSYVPLRCRDRFMFDGVRDQPGAVDERDIVGDQADPAGLRAVDAQFLYLRMRLDADAAPGATLRPFAWGFAFDTDDDPTDYEALIMLDGQTGVISIHRNTNVTVANSPTDPADLPPLSTSMFAQRGRSLGAGGGDHFLDLAIAWTDLAAVNITPTSLLRVWAGTSSTADRLDADIACHDGAGGAPNLNDNASLRVPLDPNAPGNPPLDAGVAPGQTRAIEGGPGCPCSLSSRASPGALSWLLIALWLLRVTLPIGKRSKSLPGQT
jgi:hypothetical protein